LKYLTENIHQRFTRDNGSNKLSNLGIGKRILIERWLEEHGIEEKCFINDDLTIDSRGFITLSSRSITQLPDYIQFNRVGNDFAISVNNLITLKGCPRYIEGRMLCHKNNLTNLDYAPIECTQFHCDDNHIPPALLAKFVYTHNYKVYHDKSMEFDIALKRLQTTNESFIKNSSDKLTSINIGKKGLIKKWLEEYKITEYVINDDFTINANNVILKNKMIGISNSGQFPPYIQFETVEGDFLCSDNALTSLRGCPKIVYGNFSCSGNFLTSLEYCPKIVNGTFQCNTNSLTNFKYFPEKIGDGIDCSYNKLISLIGCPKILNGSFLCYYNNLATLEGCPEIIHGVFDCTSNKLTSLEFAPNEVDGTLWISGENNIPENIVSEYKRMIKR